MDWTKTNSADHTAKHYNWHNSLLIFSYVKHSNRNAATKKPETNKVKNESHNEKIKNRVNDPQEDNFNIFELSTSRSSTSTLINPSKSF